MSTRRITAALAATAMLVGGVAACSSDADVASKNLSKDADNFKIPRRVVFYNGITDTIVLQIEGFCSLGNDDSKYITVTCKLPDGSYIKNFMLRSDNMTVVTEQLVGADVSTQRYKRVFKPSTLIPDIEVR